MQVLRDLDREKEALYSIIVKASSNRNWTPPQGRRAARMQIMDPSMDATLQDVRIFLDDINDQTPRFTKSEYTAGKDDTTGKCNSGNCFSCDLLPHKVG